MRESWTDARLDDFATNVYRRLDALESRVEDGFDRVDAEFKALNRTLFQVGGGVIVALIGLIATQL